MKPLRPAIFRESDIRPDGWAENPSSRQLWNHLLDVGNRYPSLTVAWAARPGLANVAERLAGMLTRAGLNVFLATSPVPIAALAQSLGLRQQPIGLYIDETSDGAYSALALTTHGGPILEADTFAGTAYRSGRTGVVGTTDFLEPYVKQMGQLLDTMVEGDVRLSSLDSPFAQLNQRLVPNPEFRLLFEYSPDGPKAFISPDGQALSILQHDGAALPTRDIVATIGGYLTKLRGAAGTLVGPQGTAELAAGIADFTEIEGDALEMSSQAGYIDLLLGWWENGIVAHQGHAPFGDAYLTLLYLLEAWNSTP
ncbi:MAG TPA: hypothetical protein PKM25_17610 [Candidatus Ozemobacteraceae bacterium]|nr:hypothetical protein [Candidatus Ozemobacteraceae bacterium]